MGNPFLRRRLHCDSTLAPSVSIRQTPLSLLASVLQHHLHSVKSFVSLLSLPSFRSCISPAVFINRIFFIHATVYKQAISPISCALSQLYFHSERFCSLSSVAISVTSVSLSSLSPPGPHPAPPLPPTSCSPNNSPLQVYHHALNCHTCYFSLFFFFCAFFCYLPLRLSNGYAILSQSVCALQNIKSESPARHSFLDRICFSESPTSQVLQAVLALFTLVPCSHLIVSSTAAF